MESPRVVLFVFLILFLILSPDTQQPSPSQQAELDSIIADERLALGVLGYTRYGDLDASQGRWLNITGFREDDGFAWSLLSKVKERAHEQLKLVVGDQGQKKLDGMDGPADLLQFGDEKHAGHAHKMLWTAAGQMPLYRNVTGSIIGPWIRSPLIQNIQAPQINLTALAPHAQYTTEKYERNVTGNGGLISFRLDEKKGQEMYLEHGIVREIAGTMYLRDKSSAGDGWEVHLHGVHFPDFGGVILTTTSEKFAGLFALPHFSLSSHTYTLSKALLNRTLSGAVAEQESSIFTSQPWTSSPNNPANLLFPTPYCEFVVYLQQHPTDYGPEFLAADSATLQLIEDELRFPTGAPIPHAPEMRMSMTLFSPDCGFVLESVGPPMFPSQEGNHLRGPKLESYIHSAKHFSLLYAVICGLQIILLIRQMNEASTPSTLSRISFYTIAIMAMGDGFALVVFLTLGIYMDSVFLALFSTSFMAFLCVCVFGMKFLMAIWRVQAPERRERERSANQTNRTANQARQAQAPTATVRAAGADTLPLPVTARTANDSGATPIILPPDQDLDAAEAEDNAVAPTTNQTTTTDPRSEMSTFYSRFYFILLGLVVLSLHATYWPRDLRSAYANLLSFTYLSFWTPQIYRNIIRNCRKALRWDFVIGQSILRLLPIAYLYSVPNNIVYIEVDRRATLALVAWVWVQIWALVSQEVLGPRFVIPKGWAPPAYDYHPILREDDLESGGNMPIGFTQTSEDEGASVIGSASPAPGERARGKGTRTWDCAICMQNIDVHIVPSDGSNGAESGAGSGGGLAGGILGRRSYMVTPCRHIFHSECLEGWMRFRLQCPICRETLPPL